MHPGPVNRGVELSGEVVDSPQAVITAQVEAGVVVRMAVLYEVMTGAPDRPGRPARARAGAGMTLVRPAIAPARLVLRGAHVLDPRAGIDGAFDVVVLDGRLVELAPAGSADVPDGAEVIDGDGRHVLPAFVDPHVHLRVPGQEHKEDLETGTRAAAAGGFCAVVAMPNTDPVVDSAPVLRALRDAAVRDARVPVAFTASITKGLRGEELTEMAELRDEGAIAFTDDGKPSSRPG